MEPLQHGGFPHLVERGGCRRDGNGDRDGEEEEIVVPDLDGRLYKVSEAGDFEDMGVTVMELVEEGVPVASYCQSIKVCYLFPILPLVLLSSTVVHFSPLGKSIQDRFCQEY